MDCLRKNNRFATGAASPRTFARCQRPLALAACVVIAGCVSAPAPRPAAPAAPDSLPRLAEGAAWLPGRFEADQQPDANSVVFEGPEGLVVFDTGRSAAHAQRLLGGVRATGRPVRVIVNSHWHLDHIGGNAVLRSAFPAATVMASNAIDEARTGFMARYREQVRDRLATLTADAPERRALQHELEIIDARGASQPETLVRRTQTQRLAGLELRVGLAPSAATAGDVWVFDPRSQLLAAGDLVTLPAPLLDTACPEGWLKALDQLAAVPFNRLVPGHGPVMSRTDFERWRHGYAGLLQCAASSRSDPQCIDGWLNDLGPLVPVEQQPLARNLLSHYLMQHLRQPPSVRDAHCRPAT